MLAQRAMHLIRTAARNEAALGAYRVAMPRHRLRCRKRFRSGDAACTGLHHRTFLLSGFSGRDDRCHTLIFRLFDDPFAVVPLVGNQVLPREAFDQAASLCAIRRNRKGVGSLCLRELGPCKNPLLWHCEFYAPY